VRLFFAGACYPVGDGASSSFHELATSRNIWFGFYDTAGASPRPTGKTGVFGALFDYFCIFSQKSCIFICILQDFP
jgi:hypothetical protein